MNVSLGLLVALCIFACDLASARPNLLRGRRGKSDSDTGRPTDLGSALLDDIAAKIEKLLRKLNTLPDEDGDEEWYEFYDKDYPVGNYTLNATSTIEDIGNYTIQRNTSIVIMQLSNGSKGFIMSEDFQDADAENECFDDLDCNDNQFCMNGFFYGAQCRRCVAENQKCSRHEQCCDDAVCYFGQCTTNAIVGEVGAACADAGDCGDDMCCAAMPDSLLRVCKPLARISERCDTGVQSWLNSIVPGSPPIDCPCESSLVCQDIGYFLSDNVCIHEDRVPQQNEDRNDITRRDSGKLRFDPSK